MVKYLHQLLADIAFSIEMASHLPEREWLTDFEDGELEGSISASKLKSLPAICHIPAEAFPPEKLLTDLQVSRLVAEILKLWASWRVCTSLPPTLRERQQYSALLHAMQNERVAWSMVKGGEVSVCQYSEGSFCPYGTDGGYCYCRELEESVRQDLAIWEEHVRSQGLDPYLELSAEEGAAFEEQMRLRNKKKSQGEEAWSGLGFLEILNFENLENDKAPTPDPLDDDWSAHFYWENDWGITGPKNIGEDLESGSSNNFFDKNQPEDDDFELPFL